jgi:helicase HerA-like protein
VSSFGPLLLGKVLDLNETQTRSLAYLYCNDQHLPLLDLADLRTRTSCFRPRSWSETRRVASRCLRRAFAESGRFDSTSRYDAR